MGQPGPRHRTEVMPLIIERPDLAHPLRRLTAYVVTILIWCWWIVLWVPAFEVIAADLGWPVTFYVQPSSASFEALNYLLTQFPIALAVLAVLLISNLTITELYRRIAQRPPKKALIHAAQPRPSIDLALLNRWQSERILIVTHNQLGQIIDAKSVSPN